MSKVAPAAVGTSSDKRHSNGRNDAERLERILRSTDGMWVETETGPPERLATFTDWMESSDIRWFRRMIGLDPESGLPEQDARIVALVGLYRSGRTIRQLAEIARTSKSTIGRIVAGTGRLPFDAADLDEIQQYT